ncbi:hypothetical protein [Streptomyces avermitilis]|uniref:hypothetical protein n=1 Tax=Streptomyces avermitilis TaxID=33903 RepID=UPI00339FED0F
MSPAPPPAPSPRPHPCRIAVGEQPDAVAADAAGRAGRAGRAFDLIEKGLSGYAVRA